MKNKDQKQKMLGQIIDQAINNFNNGIDKSNNPYEINTPENLLWEITIESCMAEIKMIAELNKDKIFSRSSLAEQAFIEKVKKDVQQDYTYN